MIINEVDAEIAPLRSSEPPLRSKAHPLRRGLSVSNNTVDSKMTPIDKSKSEGKTPTMSNFKVNNCKVVAKLQTFIKTLGQKLSSRSSSKTNLK